jgi:polar amino acid transport system permease protein
VTTSTAAPPAGDSLDEIAVRKTLPLRRIVLPQASRAIVLAYVKQLIGLLKGTSIIFYVSLLDLFGEVESLQSTYPGDIILLLLVATVWYVILTGIVSVVQYYVERHYSRGALRTVPPTPFQRVRKTLSELWAREAVR